jgi:hypothetical protein
LFPDRQVVVADLDEALKIPVRKLETINFKNELKISTSKMKTMTFNLLAPEF